VLEEFRDWIASTADLTPLQDESAFGLPEEPLDLHTVLSQFVALRQEVNLQTRATRTQQEQNSETLRQLQLTLESLKQSHTQNLQYSQQAHEERLRPILKTMLELADAMILAGREIQRLKEVVLPLVEEIARSLDVDEQPTGEDPFRLLLIPPSPPLVGDGRLPVPTPRRSFWRRLFGWLSPGTPSSPPIPVFPTEAVGKDLERERAAFAAWTEWTSAVVRALEEARQAAAELSRRHNEIHQRRLEQGRRVQENCTRMAQILSSFIAGYTMSLQRVERALRQQGLEAIPSVGNTFDPERMEVLEAVTDSGRPAGEVIEEIRRGYLWNGRVFRYAQVRVARSGIS
jgi:molecular chaperone GrpE